jgi:glucokinase
VILAADIGGTNARFGIFDSGRGERAVEVFPTADWDCATGAVREFLRRHPGEVASACLAVAGPVEDGRSSPVNLRWTVDARELSAALGGIPVAVVNDLEANARGVVVLGEHDLAVVNRGANGSNGHARAVVSAGTGLGEAALVWDGARYRAIPGEGGHTDFAPRSELEVELYRFLAAEHGHVSYERICSGAGLVNVYRFLREAVARHPRRPRSSPRPRPTAAAWARARSTCSPRSTARGPATSRSRTWRPAASTSAAGSPRGSSTASPTAPSCARSPRRAAYRRCSSGSRCGSS